VRSKVREVKFKHPLMNSRAVGGRIKLFLEVKICKKRRQSLEKKKGEEKKKKNVG